MQRSQSHVERLKLRLLGRRQQGARVDEAVVLAGDPRCRFVAGDFMALNEAPSGLDPQLPGRRFDAVLVTGDGPRATISHVEDAF